MPTVGRLYFYLKKYGAKPKLVLITDGAYEINGRISNFWNFSYITKKGFISSINGGDYDNEVWKFKPARGYRIETKVIKEK